MRSWLAMAVAVVLASGVEAREEMTDVEAGRLIDLALAGIDREYPNKPGRVMKSAEDVRAPRELHPVFFGHFDWHSSVHGHWTLVRLLKLFPDHARAGEARRVLDRRMTAEGLRAEGASLRADKHFERMYGWAWALRLGLELRTWDDPHGREWAARFGPVEEAIMANAKAYLPKLDWPIRCGFHPESAFALGQMLDYARGVGDPEFETLVVGKAKEFYGNDRDYPVRYEPSGNDFFSPGMNVADLMRRVLSREDFSAWLEGFFPGLRTGDLGNLLSPVSVSDLEDGHLVHLVGLNLSRAWTMRSVAGSLRPDDLRRGVLLAAAKKHEALGMGQVFSGSYEGEHWLGSFVVYLQTGVGN